MSVRTWKTFPPVTVVSGDHEHFRVRELKAAIKAARQAGRRVVMVEAGDGLGLREAMSGGVLFDDATLVVVESSRSSRRSKEATEDADSWSDADVTTVLGHIGQRGADLAVLVHHAGVASVKSFAGRVVAKLPKQGHVSFVAPKFWQVKEEAVKYLVSECKQRGKTLPEPLAEALVAKVGTDLGVLSFEALKVAMLLDARGLTEVTRDDVVGLLATFGTDDHEMLKGSLAAKDGKAVLRHLVDLRDGPSGESAMRTARTLSVMTTRWLYAAALLASGATKDEAAARLGMKPYGFEKSMLPAASRWGKAGLTDLLRRLAEVEFAVIRGHVSPWVTLESTLVAACEAAGRVEAR